MDSSALLDAAVRSRTTSAEQEVKVSPTPVIKSKKTSVTAKLKSPAPMSRAKKLSLDKTTAEKDPIESPKSKDKSTWKGRMVRHFRRHGSASGTGGDIAAKMHEVTGTFGVPLELCVSSTFSLYVPLVVEVCIQIVEEKGLDNQGIYRVPGNSGAVNQLQEELNKDPEGLDMDNERWQDVNVVSSLLKLFLRKLPDPLITDELYESVIAANHIEDQTKRMLKIKKLLHELPEHNFETFQFISQHLNLVANHESTNKMDPRNLAIVFGPTLIRPLEDSMITMVRDMSDQCRIAEMIIHHCQWFFGLWNEDVTIPFVETSKVELAPVTGVNNEMLLKAEMMASGDRSRDSSAKELVSSIFHAANKRIRRSRDKSSGRSRELGEHDGIVSEPSSYSERNIDQEVELHRLQELLRTGSAAEQVEETSKQTVSAGNHNSSVDYSASSTASTEAADYVPSSHSSKTTDPPAQREGLSSAILKERRTYFMQNGCNRPAAENSEQKRHSVDVSRLTDDMTFQETASSTAATCTSEPITTPVLANTSISGDVTLTVPSTRAIKMQRAVEQHMHLLADDLQRTFSATTTMSPPNIPSKQDQQQTATVRPPELSAGDTAARCAADSQSVTSDYSTMSSVCGGQDNDCRRSRLISADLEISTAPVIDIPKIVDRSILCNRQNRNDMPHSTPRSQSSGNFSLMNSDPVSVSPCTASAIELSQDSIDSAADHSDQLSLSLSSQMSGSQLSDSDDLLRTVGMADKQSYSPLVQSSGPVGRKPCNIDSSCVTSDAEQFGEPSVAGLTLPSVQHDSNAATSDSETNTVLDKQSCDVDQVSSEKQDVCGAQVSDSMAEMLRANTELAGPDQVTLVEQKTDCSKADCSDDTDVSQVMPAADYADKEISVYSSKEKFLQSQHPVHRLVRRHTLGGVGDLAIHVIDLKSESPLSVQSAPSQGEERLSAWQRLQPAVKDQLPNFGMWLATQRQLYHVRSSPALFVGVALSPASCLHSSQSVV